MSEAAEQGSEAARQAREGIEAAEQHLPHRTATRIAVMIGMIAVAMTALQFVQRGAQERADANGKFAADIWAFYQGKSGRATAFQTAAMVLEALPGADRPEIQERIRKLHADEVRQRDDPGGDGMKQLVHRAQGYEAERDAAADVVHRYAFVLTILQAMTVVASAAVAVRSPKLATAAGVLSLASVIYAVVAAVFGI